MQGAPTAGDGHRASGAPGMDNLQPTYLKILVLEAAIVALLWVFGRIYS